MRIEREWMQEYFSADDAADELPDPPPELLDRWRELLAADPGRDVVPARLGRGASPAAGT